MVPTGLRSGLRRTAQLSKQARPIARPCSQSIGGYGLWGVAKTAVRGFATPSESLPAKPPRYGQPVHATHPHLVKAAEITPGIPAEEYENRRKRLMESLPEGSTVICMGGTVRLVSQSIFYKFRQATDFYYLTGFNEPDAVVILESNQSKPRGYTYTLYVTPNDPHSAQWDGAVSGLDGATTVFGADEAHPLSLLPRFLPAILRRENIYASLPPSPSPSPSSQPFQPPSPRKRSSLLKLFTPSSFTDPSSSGSSSSSSSATSSSLGNADPPHLLIAAALAGERAKPLEREVHRLRVIKSPNEIALMKRAADLSSAAHTHVMRMAAPGLGESALEATFQYHCAMGGSERPAYVPVVASGANALVIHYTKNDCLIDEGDMVLIDAGCELSMYASDITRTFPASGHFSAPQRDLYEAVLSAQKGVLKQCDVRGEINLQELQRTTCRLLEEELRQIGFKLSTGDVQRKLYPHYISHHLGSDLHDCPTTDRNAMLVEGNVITIEPGIYVPSDSAFPSHFHGMGIRIEDEVAFTQNGLYILSANAPKEIVDVEAACQGLLDR